MTRHWQRILTLVLVALAGFAPALSAAEYHYSGTIASADEYDLYPIALNETTYVIADLVCAPAPNNTLDTIVSAFAPGVDASDIANATHYNDDGGSQSCGGFSSSHLEFQAYHSGTWNFRVDGFGSAVGDYTLDIVTQFNGVQAIPTLDGVGLTALALVLGGIGFAVLRRRRSA